MKRIYFSIGILVLMFLSFIFFNNTSFIVRELSITKNLWIFINMSYLIIPIIFSIIKKDKIRNNLFKISFYNSCIITLLWSLFIPINLEAKSTLYSLLILLSLGIIYFFVNAYLYTDDKLENINHVVIKLLLFISLIVSIFIFRYYIVAMMDLDPFDPNPTGQYIFEAIINIVFIVIAIVLLFLFFRKKKRFILNTFISVIFMFLINSLFQNALLSYAHAMFGYGLEEFIYYNLSNCFHYILYVIAVSCLLYGVIHMDYKKPICNGIIIFTILTFLLVPSYNKETLVYNGENTNERYSNNFKFISYTCDDTEQSIGETYNYIYIPVIKKYIMFSFNGIEIRSVTSQSDDIIEIDGTEYSIEDDGYCET